MLAVAILAAGKGSRMNSNLPKVLQPLGGITLVERVLDSCRGLEPERLLVIVGHQANLIQENLSHIEGLDFVLQDPQNGTGHAVQQLLPVLHDFEGELLVLNGDVPLLSRESIERLINQHRNSQAGVTFLTAKLKEPKGYGRVFADKQGHVTSIVEDRDCNQEQQLNNLTNAGIYCFNWELLKNILPELSTDNDQMELYITDAIAKFDNAMHIVVDDEVEVSGINDKQQMSACETLLQQRLRKYWMMRGVTFIDENSCTVSELCQFGRDVVIEPQTHLRGRCHIGDGCIIGPGSLINNSELGDNVEVLFSYINNAKIGNDIQIGPYAHLRPKTIITDECKIGNFVEVKNSVLGSGTKVNHLSYIGDAEIGRKVNIGAGTITANYDGEKKHRTVIGDNSKTGANTVLIAPIILGSEVTVGGGSTLTKNVPPNSLAIGRAKQLIKRNWKNQETQD